MECQVALLREKVRYLQVLAMRPGASPREWRGCPQDYAAALTWYRRAADQGHAGAPCNLGVFYEQGLGGLPKDDREAARLFKLAMSFAPSHLRRRRLGQ